MAYRHVSAMLTEVLTCLACKPGGVFVDGTLGGAGHARGICERIRPGGMLIGIDQDRDAIANARAVLDSRDIDIHLFHSNFSHLSEHLSELHIDAVDGILLDLGLSQYQLESSGRGFSFQTDEPLDMRMDTRDRTRAEDLVNQLPEDQLIRIFRQYGEERWAKPIARTIVRVRRKTRIATTAQLVQLVREAVPGRAAARQKIHPATRVFMALRIAVNQELTRLEEFLDTAADLIKPGGRICVLSFHSLEDRMVKQHFRRLAQSCTCPPGFPQCTCGGRAVLQLVNKKPLRPSAQEVAGNPMARSTRLRCAQKVVQVSE